MDTCKQHVDTCKHVDCCMFVMFVIHYGLIAHIQAHDRSLVFPSSPVSSQNMQPLSLESIFGSKEVVVTLLFLKFVELFPLSCLKLHVSNFIGALNIRGASTSGTDKCVTKNINHN